MKIKNEPYELVKITPYHYEFFSEGPRGRIKKMIEYDRFDSLYRQYFNLGFGDYNELTEKMDDQIITNNGDTNKVLSTVANSVLDFMDNHPNETIYARGSTPSRTRLYQIGIASIIEEINVFFEIQGFINGEWEFFQKGKNYAAFMIKDKFFNLI